MKIKLSQKQWNELGKQAAKENKESKSKEKKSKNPCWENYEMVGTKEKDGKTVPNCVPKKASADIEENKETKELKESLTDTFQANLKKINNCVEFLKKVSDPNELEGWILDKISSSADDIQDVCNYFDNYEDYMDVGECDSEEESVWCGEESESDELEQNLGKNISLVLAKSKKGKNVKLNKPFRTPSGPKKFSVYVKNDKGNVVKVNFGDPNMEIKRDSPDRKKNFRARHNCDNPGPKWKARYWSCKMWSSKNVSDLT